MNTWSNLPNAAHIDWVLASLKTHIQLWNRAGQIYGVENKAWGQAWRLVLNQAWDPVRDLARDLARLQAWNQVRDPARLQAWEAISGVILALTAYDHTDRYLDMSLDRLHTWAHLSEDPAAILLLPMSWVRQQIKEHCIE